MRLSPSVTCPRYRRQAVAAAVALLLGASLPVAAQTYYESSGVNNATPNPSDPNFSVSGYFFVGDNAVGSFSALAGAQMTADFMAMGTGAAGDGTVNITGNGTAGSTLLQLTGTGGGRVQVGGWGTGSMTVSAGAIVDASLNAAACVSGVSCTVIIGNGGGSDGTLTVTGAGTEFRAIQYFIVGNPNAVAGFGTPGATSRGWVDVLNGGTLRTQGSFVGYYGRGSENLGTESSLGTVNVAGPGSQWIIGPNPVMNESAYLLVGWKSPNGEADTGAVASGTVNVSNGGKISIDGGASYGGFLNLGQRGGNGTLTVTGKDSSVDVRGVNAGITAGSSGAGAQGSFNVLAGASASTLYLTVGRDGSTGSTLIDGRSADDSVASTLRLVGIGTNPSVGTAGPAFANIGYNTIGASATTASIGNVTVSNGAQLLISDGGMNGSAVANSPGVALGRGANASGSLTITGAGSKLEIVSTSTNPGSGDNYNPFFAVGFDNAATTSGTLMISNGGKLVMNGNAVSTVANGRATTLNVGGRSGTAATGTATVTGTGSEIQMNGYDAFINVGRMDGSTGVLNVWDGAQVSTISLAVGIGTTGAALGPNKARGTVNIDDAKIVLSGVRTDASQVGAGTAIGRGTNGVGTLNMTNGAQLQINPTVLAGGMSIGGDQFLAGGTGTVGLDGGSSITFGGTVNGNRMTIGHSGSGTMTLNGASLVDVGALGETVVGRLAGGVGTLTVSGGSTFRSGSFGVGGFDESVAGGTGTATFSGAGTVLDVYGATGLAGVGFGGNGNLSVTNQATLKGTVLAVGAGATGNGTVTLNNATVNLAGQANDPNIAVAGAGLLVGGFGGSGTVNIGNGTQVTITNNDNLGANLSVGGFGSSGNGTLNVSGGSQIKLNAAPGLANARIGHNGSGTATFSGASLLDVGSGNVFVAAQPGSVGTLVLNGGSSVNAGFVGVGVSSAGTGKNLGAPGGIGTLDLGEVGSEGSINAPRFELGVGSTLTGSGTINAGPEGEVVIGGTIAPGRSPGRIRIYCDVTVLFGSQLILEVDGTGAELQIDQLVIGNDSTFDLTQLQIVFAFVGDTNPNDIDLDLNDFLRTSNPNGSDEDSLAALFGEGQNWGNVVNSNLFAFTSSAYDVTSYRFNPATGRITGIQANPVPEPATFALALLALALMTHYRRRAGARR